MLSYKPYSRSHKAGTSYILFPVLSVCRTHLLSTFLNEWIRWLDGKIQHQGGQEVIISFTNLNEAWTPSIAWHFRKLLHREPSKDSDGIILFAMSDDSLMLTTQDSGPMAIVWPGLSVLPRGPSLGRVWFVPFGPFSFSSLAYFLTLAPQFSLRSVSFFLSLFLRRVWLMKPTWMSSSPTDSSVQ